MKQSRFSEEQIAYALRMADGGTPAVDVCRQIGISEAMFCANRSCRRSSKKALRAAKRRELAARLPRDSKPGAMHLAYVRDPDGNKLCAVYRPA